MHIFRLFFLAFILISVAVSCSDDDVEVVVIREVQTVYVYTDSTATSVSDSATTVAPDSATTVAPADSAVSSVADSIVISALDSTTIVVPDSAVTPVPTLPAGAHVISSTPAPTVDLGLSVLWAQRNLGADDSLQAGAHIAMSELDQKDVFSQDNYQPFYGFDVAQLAWGDGWRLPTRDEFMELLALCKWSKAKGASKDVPLAIVTGPSGLSISLPCAGLAMEADIVHESNSQWRSGRYASSSDSSALHFYVNTSATAMGRYVSNGSESPWCGFSIRPVHDK